MLHNATSVRLYLRCTFLSEITSPDMTSLAGWATTGGPPSQCSESYPDQPRLTTRMLQHWRQLLRSCFLLSNNQLANPPSHSTPLPQAPPPTLFSHQYLAANEDELSIMGPGVLYHDEIATLFTNCLSSALPIKAFGDGTVKDGIGAHGWHIRPDLNLTNDLYSIESAA